MAKFRNPLCKSSEETIAKALTGNYRPEHVFALKQALELYDFYNRQIEACDHELEAKFAAFKPRRTDTPIPPKRVQKRKNNPPFDLRTYLYQLAGIDLTAVDGLDVLTVQTIISEIGIDMSKWPTVKHFASWLGVAPNNQTSAGKIIRRGTKKTTNPANVALRIAARSLHHSDSALGGFPRPSTSGTGYRRMRAKHGAPKANVATAHKLARLIYFMLKNQAEYHDPGFAEFEKQHRERAIHNLKRKAAKLGLNVVPGTV